MFGEQRERDALHGPRRDHLQISAIEFRGEKTSGGGRNTSRRVSGSTCTERKVSRCGSADGWSVNASGLDVHTGIPRRERSRISGCDSRNAAKSGSSLLTLRLSAHCTKKRRKAKTVKHAPDGRLKGTQAEWGVSREYPRESAMFALVHRYLYD